MSWIDIERDVKTLEATTVNATSNDQAEVYNHFDSIGIVPSSAVAPEETNAQYSTPIANVRTILQEVELNFKRLSDIVESVYYGDMVNITSSFTKEMYQRWYDILYDYKNNIIPDNRGWAILELTDCIPTIDGKDIAIRGEEFGT